MNTTVSEAVALTGGILAQVDHFGDVDVVVCPPFLAVPKMREVLQNTRVKLGAQDCFWADRGAFTGRVSAQMLREHCCDYCIVGHSEARGRFGTLDVPSSTVPYFAETDETVNLKIKALNYNAIAPILCVGETAIERKLGETDRVIERQVRGALSGVQKDEMYTLILAYEPVWAIGTGDVCEDTEAERVCATVRSILSDIADPDVADCVRVLYGGSVKPSNAKSLFSQPNIDGGLVGGASLDADGFVRIVLSA